MDWVPGTGLVWFLTSQRLFLSPCPAPPCFQEKPASCPLSIPVSQFSIPVYLRLHASFKLLAASILIAALVCFSWHYWCVRAAPFLCSCSSIPVVLLHSCASFLSRSFVHFRIQSVRDPLSFFIQAHCIRSFYFYRPVSE